MLSGVLCDPKMLIQIKGKVYKRVVWMKSRMGSPFVVPPVFQNTSISILGINVSSDCQYRDHLKSKAKLVSKKLGVITRARRYFPPKLIVSYGVHKYHPHQLDTWHSIPQLWNGLLAAAFPGQLSS